MLLQIIVGKVQIRTVVIPFSGLLGVLLEKVLLHVFSYFGSILISLFLFFISLFLIFQVPLVSIFEKWLHREKPPPKPNEVRVVQEPREEPKKEKRWYRNLSNS